MTDVVVVGAGVIGLCAAYALRKRGLAVVVIEQGQPGEACSHGNGGWVCPSFSGPLPAPGLLTTSLRWLLRPASPLYIQPRLDPSFIRWLWLFWRKCNERDYVHGLEALARLNTRTMPLYDALAADGIAFEMHKQGLLFLFRSESAARAEARDLARLEKYGYPPAQWLTPAEAREVEPTVGEEVVAGLLAPSDRHVRPESVCRGLVRHLGELGVPVRTEEPVLSLQREGDRVTGVRTSREVIQAGHVVLAAGAWTARLAAQIGVHLPLEAGKGYSVTMSPPPVTLQHPVYCAGTRVGCTPFVGAMRILGTMELSGLNTRLAPRRVAALKTAPQRYLRDWQVANVQEEWTGMRPLTPDGLPVIGPAPTAENVVLATGHAMLGVTLAPATGEAVADIITGKADSEVLVPFRVGRF
jgi:D-amino-acid dehydrogenase